MVEGRADDHRRRGQRQRHDLRLARRNQGRRSAQDLQLRTHLQRRSGGDVHDARKRRDDQDLDDRYRSERTRAGQALRRRGPEGRGFGERNVQADRRLDDPQECEPDRTEHVDREREVRLRSHGRPRQRHQLELHAERQSDGQDPQHLGGRQAHRRHGRCRHRRHLPHHLRRSDGIRARERRSATWLRMHVRRPPDQGGVQRDGQGVLGSSGCLHAAGLGGSHRER